MHLTQPQIEEIYTSLGGTFLLPVSSIARELLSIKAIVLDWDGVFNDGTKGLVKGSTFNEVDSAGLNMLRFAFFLRDGVVPPVAIITGQNNPVALELAQREHFNCIKSGVLDKKSAIEEVAQSLNLQPAQCACIWDDYIDFGMATKSGLSIMIGKNYAPATLRYVLEGKLATYISGKSGGNGGLREVCELLLDLIGNSHEAFFARQERLPSYLEYWSQRQEIKLID